MLRNSVEALKSRPQLFRAKLGVYLLITSLGVFFLAALIAYGIIRTSVAIHLKPLEMPLSFIVSTILLLINSVLLHMAVVNVRKEKQQAYRKFLTTAMVVGFLFLLLQGEGMVRLIRTHLETAEGTGKLYGICFTLALLHALHVVGGIAFLAYIWIQSRRDRYDHERHWTVDICASYWHFLDVVWIVMLLTFWVTEVAIRS